MRQIETVRKRAAFFIGFLVAVLAWGGAVLAADLAGPRSGTGSADILDLPVCDSQAAVSAALRMLKRAEPVYRSAYAQSLSDIVETGVQADTTRLTARFCAADGVLNDDTVRRIYYRIGQRQGFVGLSWNVKACILGLDPWHVSGRDCRVVRISRQPAPVLIGR